MEPAEVGRSTAPSLGRRGNPGSEQEEFDKFLPSFLPLPTFPRCPDPEARSVDRGQNPTWSTNSPGSWYPSTTTRTSCPASSVTRTRDAGAPSDTSSLQASVGPPHPS